MAHVITEPCIGTKDTKCVEACPVNCIHPVPGAPGFDTCLLYTSDAADE